MTFDRQGEDGLIRKVTEQFLVDALFYGCEARIVKEVQPFVTESYSLQILNVLESPKCSTTRTGDKWYRCKINYLSVDEMKGVEKRISQTIMVQATCFKGAVDTIIRENE